jgi:predicted TIM-barrel fold metal-dependent hydrolase
MGFIDSDAHVRESEATWAHADPAERDLMPEAVDGTWQVAELSTVGAFDAEATPEGYHELFPRGSADLSDPKVRVARMDRLGIDVQVLFSTWWIGSDVADPRREAALARSWNRWMAERTADSGGRLRWILQAPVRLPNRARQEMEFGRTHGAVGVHMRGLRHGLGVGSAEYDPLHAAAEELGLVMAVHVGGDMRVIAGQPHLVMLNNLAPVPAAFHAVVKTNLGDRFPALRWAFLECGASWLPFVIQEALRSDGYAGFRNFKDWRPSAAHLLSDHDLYVACQIDDDIPYLVDLVGGSNLVLGTDYGHLDVGSDPYGLQILAARATDSGRGVFADIVDGNARQLWGIPSDFTPAPPPAEDVPQLGVVDNWMAMR